MHRRLHWPSAAILALGAIVAAAGAVAAEGDSRDLEGRRVAAVVFDADEPLDAESLRALLPLRAGDLFSAEALAASTRYLEWKDVWSRVDPELQIGDEGVRVVYHLRIKRTVSSVAVSGYDAFYAEDLVRRVRIAAGAALDPVTVEEARERLREFYRRGGFPDVKVSVIETPEAHRQVSLDFHIEEGDPVLVSAVIFEGDLGVPPAEVARAVEVRGRDRFTVGLDREVKRRALAFYRTRRFYDAQVSVRWEPYAGGKSGVLLLTISPGIEHEIVLIGNRSLSRRRLLGLMDLERRPAITEATWRQLRRRIADEYRLEGYYRSRVDLEVRAEPGLSIIEFQIEEGPRYWVRSIEFVGNDDVPSGVLLDAMRTRPASRLPFSSAGTLDDQVLADDLRKIWFLYRRYGFESAQVVDSRRSFDPGSDAIDLVIEIDEGPRSLVREVTLVGFEALPDSPALRTRIGEPYDPADRDADVETLAGALAREGYPRARVNADTESVRAGTVIEARVRFVADPGPLRRVGPIVVQGNLITKDRVVLRELPFREGAPYDPQELVDGQTNVYRLGLFRQVEVRPLDPEGAPAPAVGVRVDERPAGTLSYGFGYETDIGVRVFGEVAYDNLQGMDRRLSLRGDGSVQPTDPSQSQYIANLGYRVPRIFDTRWVSRSNVILLRNTQSLNRYSLEGLTMATALEREIWPRFVVGGAFEWDQADTFDVEPDADLAPEGVKDVGFLRQVSVGPFLELDRRDDPFAPRTGTLDTFRVRYADPQLNSDIRFLSLIGKHTQYVPIGEHLTFVYALRGALALPLDGKFSVPIRDRYFIGGRTTVRGFQENSIAPLGAEGSPMGGDVMVIGNAEVRFPLLFGLGGAVFFDAGGSFLRQECTRMVCNDAAVDIENVRRSAGLGLRYLTPVGPISLEYGFKLDRRNGESIGAFHFTIGNIF